MKGLGAKYVVLLATAYFIPGVKTGGEKLVLIHTCMNIHAIIPCLIIAMISKIVCYRSTKSCYSRGMIQLTYIL